jgi:hypothetical protein
MCDMTFWASVHEAAEAARELSPCGRDCIGDHLIVTNIDGEPRVVRRRRLKRRNHQPEGSQS